MPTSYPSGLDSFTTKVNGQVIDSSHVNNLQDPVMALELTLGPNPVTVSDTTTPSPSIAWLGGWVSAPNIGYASMVATMLRLITGGAAWYTNPVTTLAALNAGKLPIPGGSTLGDILYYNGTSWVRLPIGTTGQFLDVSGGIPTWVTPNASALGVIPAPASPALGDLLYYNGSAWVRLPIGAANQLLAVSGGIPAWMGSVPGTLNDGAWTSWDSVGVAVNLKIRLPVVISSDGTLTEYANLQNAITAATSGQWVAVPPGVYTGNIALKTGVTVSELIQGTVTINGTVTTAANAVLRVGTINGVLEAITGSGSLTSCVITVENITSGAPSSNYGIHLTSTATGTLDVYVNSISTTSSSAVTVAGVYAEAGTVNLHMRNGASIQATAIAGANCYSIWTAGGTVSVFGGSLSTSGGTTNYDLYDQSGTLNVYACQYDVSKTSGVLTFLRGDRMRPAQISLFNQVFSR